MEDSVRFASKFGVLLVSARGPRGHVDTDVAVYRRVYTRVSAGLRPLLPAGWRGDGDLITASAKAP